MDQEYFYDRNMFFTELSQSTERKKLSTNVLFVNYLNDFKDIVQHNGLVPEEMNIICHLLCTLELNLKTFKQILSTLVPENPTIPSEVCEELIVLALSIARENVDNMKKAQCIFYWLLYVVEEKLTNLDAIDKYYKMLFHLCDYGNLNLPLAGIIYLLTKPGDVQNWMITCCRQIINVGKNEPSMKILLNFFENPNLIHETRQKGLFDSKSKFVVQLANGLRSVRKELMNKHPNSTSTSQPLTEYVKKNSDTFYSIVKFVDVNNKFELPRTQDLAKVFMDQNISPNSLSLLDNISGWFYLLMNTDEKLNLQQRFSNNLSTSLDQIINENNIKEKTKFLQQILEFQKFAHRGLTAVNSFIFKYIISWDGIQCAWIFYNLFEYLTFTSEEELKIRFLEKLYPIFITGDALIYKIIINSLSNLLCNLHLNSRQTKLDKDKILFGEQLREETEFEIVKCLTNYISKWCSICIYHYPQDDQLKHAVYSFFEKVSVLENLKPCIWNLYTIMTPNVFYNGLMSINIYWLNRLAKLMIRHIKIDTTRIEEMTSQSCIPKSFQMFQLYMADFYNALKAGKMFDKREEGFIFKNINREEILKDLNFVNLNICFKMEKHIALAPYYMNAENTIEDALDFLKKVAPNVHELILLLDSNLQDNSLNKSATY